jgi:hypothetical protein
MNRHLSARKPIRLGVLQSSLGPASLINFQLPEVLSERVELALSGRETRHVLAVEELLDLLQDVMSPSLPARARYRPSLPLR